MDKVLKAHFDSFIGKGLPPELKLDNKYKLFNDASLLATWRNNFKGISYADDKGNVLHGAVDNILVKNSKLVVLDYKTRGFPLKEDTHQHYQDQMDIYNFLLRKNGYETEDYTYLLFYHPHKVLTDGHVCFNTDLVKIKVNIKNAETIFKTAIRVLDEDCPKPNLECGFCKWVEEAGV